MVSRLELRDTLLTALARSRIVVVVGPRQCGKTTLARELVAVDSLNYFDLEDPVSLSRLEQPMTALAPLVDKAGCSLILISNRGFGRSSKISHVTRDSFVEDGIAAADFVHSMPGVDPDRVACFGYSFGGMTSVFVKRTF